MTGATFGAALVGRAAKAALSEMERGDPGGAGSAANKVRAIINARRCRLSPGWCQV
jgi:hypothetical protein